MGNSFRSRWAGGPRADWLKQEPVQFVEYKLQLARPMIGGGAQSGKPDEHWAIRSTAIRGHLRFWWRATCGCGLANAQSLRERESELWGAVAGTEGSPSRIVVDVRINEVGQIVPVAEVNAGNGRPRNFRLPPYVGGVLTQDADHPDRWPKCLMSATFTVRLYAHSSATDQDKKEAQAALRAWIAYGGLGARTRRGCGSLEVLEGEQVDFPGTLVNAWRAKVPSLHRAVYATKGGFLSAQEAHQAAIDLYQAIRKGKSPLEYRDLANAAGHGQPLQFPFRGDPSHTTWPERGALHAFEARRSNHLLAPRAMMGLPYTVRSRGGVGAPPAPVTFTYAKTDRFASPVICKAVGSGNEWTALILVLCAPIPSDQEVLALREDRTQLRVGVHVSLQDAPGEINARGYLDPRAVIGEYARSADWSPRMLQ